MNTRILGEDSRANEPEELRGLAGHGGLVFLLLPARISLASLPVSPVSARRARYRAGLETGQGRD